MKCPALLHCHRIENLQSYSSKLHKPLLDNPMRTIILVAVLGVVLVDAPEARSQAPEDKSTNPILLNYRSKLPLLIERYSTNRKIRIRDVLYLVEPAPGETLGTELVNTLDEMITDGQQIKRSVLESKVAYPVMEQSKSDVKLWRPDMRFDIRRSGNEFKIVNQKYASSNYHSHEALKYGFCVHMPMTAGGNCVGTTLWLGLLEPKSQIVTIVDVKPATHKGRECIEVRAKWDNLHGMVEFSNTYLDPANDYITITAETDWKRDLFTQRESRSFDEIEYTPSAEGFPLPKFYRRRVQFRDDDMIHKAREVEFLSYERYVPAAEEFQLEKPYGLATPAPVALEKPLNYDIPPVGAINAVTPPPLPRWGGPWAVYVVVALFAVVAMAVIVTRRSRRSVSPRPEMDGHS